MLGRPAKPVGRQSVIHRHTQTPMMHEPDALFEPGIAAVGPWLPEEESERVIAGIEGIETGAEIVIGGPGTAGCRREDRYRKQDHHDSGAENQAGTTPLCHAIHPP